jgi:DNA helicase IV
MAAIGDGRIAVITPSSVTETLADALAARLPGSAVANRSAPLDGLVAVLGVADTKGLEFDAVVVVEPAAITAESERGLSDLYVALTRATRRLGVLHTTDLPSQLDGLHRVAVIEDLDLSSRRDALEPVPDAPAGR